MSRTLHETSTELPALKRPSINPVLLVILVAALALLGGFLVLRFVTVQNEREILSWQNRLSLIADSRAEDIEAWLDRHFKELGDVASNPSLQLYLTEIMSEPETKTAPAEAPEQVTFLRNLLSITADRLGFVDQQSEELKSIHADVRQPSGVGVAIIDNNRKVLVSTAGLPNLTDDLMQKIEQAPQNEPSLIDIFTAPNGSKQIGFLVPIYAIESADRAPKPIGHLVAVKNAGPDLFELLHHPGVTEKTLEAVLLRKDGENVTYLSPQIYGGESATALALNTPELDAAYAIASPGIFAVKKNAHSQTTLMTSRAIAHSPWVLLLHVDRDQALGESDIWVRQIECSMIFALLAVIGFVIAAWYYGTSRRTMLLSLQTQHMALQAVAQERLLRVVADNQLEPIVIADQDNIARFANAKAAEAFHMDTADIPGKDLTALVGPLYAKGYADANRQALAQQTPAIRTWSMESAGGTTVIRSQHIPLEHIPIDGLPVPSAGVLMIDQDITEIMREREQRMRILKQMIDMLVHMVDRRDPNAANHSACVALITRVVADGMGLDPVLADTAETSGKLMNIGKILVPSAVLTKAAALSDSEKSAIRDALSASIAMLKDIEFDGPVVDTLRQAQEYYDGSGPLGMKGEAILITARIIAVANAFVAMISPRSYRAAIAMEDAIKNLLSGIDTQFDRRVVVALANYAENKHGREAIMGLVRKQG